jgi:hypothetical protein
MRGLVLGYASSCRRHSHDAPLLPLVSVLSAVTLTTDLAIVLVGIPWAWDVEVNVSALCTQIQWAWAKELISRPAPDGIPGPAAG